MGEVVTPGSYPYADNSTLQDIILQSGGLTEAGSLAKVDVYRRVKDATAVADGVIRSEVFSFSLDERYAVQQDTTFYLQPYDIVIVRKSPIYEVQRSVVITGEVNFDGSYIIANENYRLSDLIKACGGMTNMAYVKGARLTRRMNANELEQREYADLIAQIQLYENGLTEGKNLDMQIAEELYKLKKNKSDKYVVAMDLQRAIDEPGSSYDLLLREGDVIEIPKQMTTIKVSGEVMGEISMPYEEGKSVKYYIKHAGGYTEGAATSRIYGINANGGVVKLKKSSKKAIQPGMEIVVPKKNMRRKLTTGEIIGIGSAVASLASVVIALINTTSK
jgi:protein involved in polysaccharide export with SLBB domain